MIRKTVRSLVVLVLMSSATLVHAFVDPPTLSPTNPLAGQTIYVHVRAGICDAYYYGVPGYPQITRTGNAIRIVLESAHSYLPILCNFPIGTATYPVGTFSGGSYTLQVDRHYVVFLGPEVVETVGTLAFTVTEPAPLPALTLPSLLLLASLLAIAA